MPYQGKPIKKSDYNFESTANEAGFKQEDINKAMTINIEHSSFSDPGEDWNKYTLVSEDDNIIDSVTKPGY